MTMLSPEQKLRVERFLSDDWADETDNQELTAKNLGELMAGIESAEELHAMAAGYNWDCEGATLWQLLQHPKCDVATIQLAYWRAAPGYYCKYASERDIPEHERPAWQMVQQLHQLLASRLHESSRLGFDPHADSTADGYDWTADHASERSCNGFYAIPSSFSARTLPR